MAHILLENPLCVINNQRNPSVAIPLRALSAFIAHIALDEADDNTEFIDTVAMETPGILPSNTSPENNDV